MTENKKRGAPDLDDAKPKKAKIVEEKKGKDQNPRKFIKGKKDGGVQDGKKFKGKFAGKNNKKGPKKEEFKKKADGKTDWNDVKAKKKELKAQRKKNRTKDLYEVSVQAKQLYEKLKCKATPDKHTISQELHNIMKTGNCYAKLVHSHDIARIVQCLLKYSPGGIRKEICEILIPHIVTMSMSKYSHFCVARMLKYGTKEVRGNVVQALLKNIVKLTAHNFSNAIVDVAYNMHATPEQKAAMRQEFYSDLFKSDKNKKVERLSDTWKDSTEFKDAILSRTKANLLRCANKNLVDNSLIHTVLMDFLGECKQEDKQEFIQAFTEVIAHLPSTKDGVYAAILLYLHSQAKERRAILKVLKEHVQKTCNHEFGHLFMIAIINCTDDTVMLNKQVFPVILSHIEEIAAHEHGRKVLEWIIAPEDSAFFHPQFVKEMNEGLKFGKKEAATRRAEILKAVTDPLCEKVAANPSFWLRGGTTALVTCAIVKLSEKANEALAAVICDPTWEVAVIEATTPVAEEEEKVQIPSVKIKKIKKNPMEEPKEPVEVEKCAGIEHSGLHVALKKMIKQGKGFGATVVEKITTETIEHWATKNRACFILLNLVENSTGDVLTGLKKKIDKKLIGKQKHPGAKILLGKI